MRQSLLLLVVAAASLVGVRPAIAGEPAPPSAYLWLDVHGRPLPFQGHDAIREAMRSAPIVSRKPIGRGVAGSVKLVLEHGETRFHAVFRAVDRAESVKRSATATKVTYRDSHVFEVAAYELDRMLGLHRVPPAVRRTVDGRDGSVQIWMEGTVPEDVLVREGRLDPPDAESWRRQKRAMRVFDNLIANSDRNQGNILVDRHWRLWLIDHTRTFGETSRLLSVDKVEACDRRQWRALVELDEASLRQRLAPYLTSRQISRLLLRRAKLIRHIQKLIDERGEGAVLFDLEL